MRLFISIFISLFFLLSLQAEPVPENFRQDGRIVDAEYSITFADMAPSCPWQLAPASEELNRFYSCTNSKTNEQASVSVTTSDGEYKPNEDYAVSALSSMKKQMKKSGIKISDEKIQPATLAKRDVYLITASLHIDNKKLELLHYVIANNHLMSLHISRNAGSNFGAELIKTFEFTQQFNDPEDEGILIYMLMGIIVAGAFLIVMGIHRRRRKNKTLT